MREVENDEMRIRKNGGGGRDGEGTQEKVRFGDCIHVHLEGDRHLMPCKKFFDLKSAKCRTTQCK